ncbi:MULTISPECIES: hypothetical protein [Pseudoalteromonas]|uniref:hypothetical protein n=1 Tax=Pseudoalteromonas TaxID=53246 RepID=UPI0019D2EAA0|nr:MULTISPECIES: hypothetical protein [Pseudoalteromonas]MBR8845657.1 hypothetical protein [Pseudoalteromonas sp. JC3]MCF7514546.1 hypothetical protein [Pseudoalteromonas sp. L7]MCF7526675.1 hypothetical protein [Pseudoalteromonas sp. L23]MCX2766385.1 hypothetical protein [Pseudoalteromonas sp. B530]QUI72651.1 hypothetical protein GSF13_24365 [Pseudoalteromonas sp. M8]
MEKNIAHPTDSKLLEKCRDKLVGFAKQAGIRLRQSYERIGPRTAQKVAGYAHAKQFKRMMKKQKNYLIRVMKDILRKITGQPSQEFIHTLQQADRLLKQEKRVKTNSIAYMGRVLNVSPRKINEELKRSK